MLGPFQGTSSQRIGHDGAYQNFLNVAPNDWLTATLDGVWEDWDGVVIRDKADKVPENVSTPDPSRDWGASRVWRTTYLKDDVRIVRAGKTGRREDEVYFYTRRNPAPTPLYDYQK